MSAVSNPAVINPAVVITSIHAPSDALQQWAAHFPVIVVADRKTPEVDYEGTRFHLLGFEGTHRLASSPHNHYSRKNLGYLQAVAAGHNAIIDTDDDTWPTLSPSFLEIEQAHRSLVHCPDSEYVNVFALRLPGSRIWPRGFPLGELERVAAEIEKPERELVAGPVAVVQFLIDGDTDVDAIHRLVFGARDVNFIRVGRLQVLPAGAFCPFNTQLTLVSAVAFPLLYLPTHVSFRFTDILRSVIAKRVLDALDLRVAFGDPAGYQRRNEHDLFRDFIDELPMYQNVAAAWDCLRSLSASTMPALLTEAYERLVASHILPPQELPMVDEWLEALATATSA